MTSFIVTEPCPFGGKQFVKIIVEGDNTTQLKESFDAAIRKLRPEPNKFQKELYGEAHLNSLSDETIRKIVHEKRGMGNTTAHAMMQIAEAIKNPGKEIKLYRDEGENKPVFVADYVRSHVEPMIEKLGLKFMVIDVRNLTLKFDV